MSGTMGQGVLRRYERRQLEEPRPSPMRLPIPADAWAAILTALDLPPDTPAGRVAAAVAELTIAARIGGRRRRSGGGEQEHG